MTNTSIQNIIDWLDTNAPRIKNYSLNPEANEEDFTRLESLIKRKLPNDFKELYNNFNGMNSDENMGSLFYGMPLFSIDEIIEDYNQRMNLLGSGMIIPLKKVDPQIEASSIFNENWVPFSSDSATCRLCIDFNPTLNGTFGQVIFIDGTDNIAIYIADSLSALIDIFSTDLEKNLYTLHPDALEDGQHFLEADKSIDLINWYKVDKWKHFSIN